MVIKMRSGLVLALGGALVLAGCGRSAGVTTASPRQAIALDRLAAELPARQTLPTMTLTPDGGDRLTPEGAEGKARTRAAAWQPDAELRFVGWGVAKWELLSAVSHVFYSPKTKTVLAVNTALTTLLQGASAFDQAIIVNPAKILHPLGKYKVDGRRALAIATQELPGWSEKPLSLAILTRPTKLNLAVWSVVSSNGNMVLIDASTGTAIGTEKYTPFPIAWLR